MEGPRTFTVDEQAPISFVGLHDIASGNITPLSELPVHYRQELDKGYSSGWQNIDRYLQGIRMGEVTVITADTGAGKTTFCTQLMVNCAMQGIPVWVNSWEMKPETTMRKLASIILRKPMKMCDFSDTDNATFDAWTKHYHVYVNPNTIGSDIHTLERDLHEANRLGVKVVMLDHLDYLVNTGREKLHEAIDETVKRLHELAFGFRMHFLLICHPRQSSGTEEVSMHGIKGSSSIKQYADNILILHRCSRTDEQAHPGKVRVRICKNRMFGTEGSAYMFYNPMWDGYQEFNDTQGAQC